MYGSEDINYNSITIVTSVIDGGLLKRQLFGTLRSGIKIGAAIRRFILETF